jgi:hypothetical protein
MSNLAVVTTPSLTDLVTADKADTSAIMAMLGQSSDAGSSTKSVDFLPKLSIEHNTEDEEGNALPRGQWKFKDSSGDWQHTKELTFRPFLRRYMYTVLDNAEQTYGSMTIQAASFGDEFFDNSGGIRCGKLGKKELALLDPDDPERTLQANVKCAQVIYGTAETDEIAATPVVWYARGSNFMPVADWIKTLEKQGKLMFNTRAKLSTLRQKYGGNIYYKSKIDVKDYVEFDPAADVPILEKFVESVNSHNAYIESEYKDARGEFADAEIVEALDSND